MVKVVQHFAVVAGFIVKFGASQRGFTINHCRSNSRGGECTSAKYLFGFEIVVVEDNDVTYAAGYCTCNGAGSSHPSFRWEGIIIGR